MANVIQGVDDAGDPVPLRADDAGRLLVIPPASVEKPEGFPVALALQALQVVLLLAILIAFLVR